MLSGSFFDKQLPRDFNRVNRWCGLWGVTGFGGPNIAVGKGLGILAIDLPYRSY